MYRTNYWLISCQNQIIILVSYKFYTDGDLLPWKKVVFGTVEVCGVVFVVGAVEVCGVVFVVGGGGAVPIVGVVGCVVLGGGGVVLDSDGVVVAVDLSSLIMAFLKEELSPNEGMKFGKCL